MELYDVAPAHKTFLCTTSDEVPTLIVKSAARQPTPRTSPLDRLLEQQPLISPCSLVKPHDVIETSANEILVLPTHPVRKEYVVDERAVREVRESCLVVDWLGSQVVCNAHPHELIIKHRNTTFAVRRIEVDGPFNG